MRVMLLLFFVHVLYATLPSSGKRDWQYIAENESIGDIIESKVCQLQIIPLDIDGTYTAIEAIVVKQCTVNSKLLSVEQDVSVIDDVQSSIDSKLDSINPAVQEAISLVDALHLQSLSGTYTVIDAITVTQCSKLNEGDDGLLTISSKLDDFASQKDEEFVATITTINAIAVDLCSLIEELNESSESIESNLAILDGSLTLVKDKIQTLDSNVDVLQNEVEQDFQGTFTSIDLLFNTLCTITSSLEDLDVNSMIDLSGTFTMLNQIETKLALIDSQVDTIFTLTAIQIQAVDSAIDTSRQLLQKADAIESLTDVLLDNIILIASEIDQAQSNIDASAATLDVLYSVYDVAESKVCIIDSEAGSLVSVASRLDVAEVQFEQEIVNLNSQLEEVVSQFDHIEQKMCTIESKVLVTETTIDAIDSVLDDVIEVDASIESILEDVVTDIATIESKACVIESLVELTSPRLISLLDVVQNDLSKTCTALNLALTLESITNEIIDSSLSLESSIDIIRSLIDDDYSKACVIESNIAGIEQSFVGFISVADLIDSSVDELAIDLQGTWTVLDVIEQKACIVESLTEDLNSKIDFLATTTTDMSGTFTALDALLVKTCTIESQVSELNSILDTVSGCDTVDLTGLFTLIDASLEQACTISSKLEPADSQVERLVDCLGVPIRQRDVGTTGYTISESGKYFLVEDIDFAPSAAAAAITISASNVDLNLNDRTITQTNSTFGVNGVSVSSMSVGVTIEQGTIQDTTSNGILVNSTCFGVKIAHIDVIGSTFAGGAIEFESGCGNIMLIYLQSLDNDQDGVVFNTASKVMMNVCLTNGNGGSGVICNDSNDVTLYNCISNNNTERGFRFIANSGTNSRFQLQNCLAATNGDEGFLFNDITDSSMVNCTAVENGDGIILSDCANVQVVECASSGNVGDGLELSLTTSNCYIGDCVFVRNSNINLNETTSGRNAYLGNFGFNTTAAKNYTLNNTGANTIVQGTQTAAFGTTPLKWNNVSMT